jgi:surface glycoprotein (TIGR04207 family)
MTEYLPRVRTVLLSGLMVLSVVAGTAAAPVVYLYVILT